MGLPRRRAWPCKNTMGLGSDAQATAESAPPRPGQALLSVGRHRSAIALAPQSSRQAAQNSPPPASYSSAADAATSTTRAEPCRCDTDPATPRMHNRTAVAQPRTVHHTSARPTPPENGIPDFRSALHRRRFRGWILRKPQMCSHPGTTSIYSGKSNKAEAPRQQRELTEGEVGFEMIARAFHRHHLYPRPARVACCGVMAAPGKGLP